MLWVCGGGIAGAGNWRVGGREEEREAGESHILDLCSVSVVPDLCSGSLCGSGCPSL